MISNINNARRARLVISSALLLSWVWVCVGARADEQVHSETVKFHDLNVSTPEGARTLFDRIHAAANRVCDDSDPMLRYAAVACARKAEANAIAKLNLPQLTAYYKAKNGEHIQPLIAAR